ncbi:HAMP domain-containing histidine kinase [Pendulispora brunnea]|uniref:histidine kinase n=1 Tax=Pendulispora brunnea TaxID=2905690 RepID=A0ABZ2K4M2_9BACT
MSPVPTESSIDVLVRFARLASEARAGAKVLPLLADALVKHVKADAVAVLAIGPGGATFVPSRHLPKELEGVQVDPDVIGEELGAQLVAACHGRFAHVRSHPLVSGGGLFGSVVMFFATEAPHGQVDLGEALVDLAAIALASDAQLQQLVRSHAELRASQETLARSEKLRALGQMAAGVSHDLKNILNPLSLHLQLLARGLERGKTDDAKETIAEMKQVLTRGLQTLERLREYSRQSPEPRTENVDLNRLVHEAAEIARPRMTTASGRRHRVDEELGAPPIFRGRAGDIVSALVNLVVNAVDAMPDGGTITLRTGASNGGSWVQIADDGPGIPEDVQRRVFEPFFTTKGEEGTGLGLAMVEACARRHGGSIKLDTAVGKGTTFTLWFPLTAP